MPYWRNIMLAASHARGANKGKFVIDRHMVLFGITKKAFANVMTGWNQEYKTLFFGTNNEGSGFCVALNRSNVLRSVFIDKNGIKSFSSFFSHESSPTFNLVNDFRLGLGDEGRDIFVGYARGGLAYHASRWNITL